MAIDKIMTAEAAETLALRGLQFLASDDERIGFFLNTTGTQPQDLFRDAADPAFLLGVLDYLLADESLLFMFAETAQIAPELPASARYALAGPETGGDGMS